MNSIKRKPSKISLFGHFGQINLGNESTLQAILCHIRRYLPDAEITCVCTYPEVVNRTYKIDAVPMMAVPIKPLWFRGSRCARFLRKIVLGIPSELYRWLTALRTLKGTDMLIVPGTGLLTDACGLSGWGPYTLFKWSLVAKLCRCKLLFVSVGAGPIYSTFGKYLVKFALSLADFRSYRDDASMKYLEAIGFQKHSDRVYPDLAFSLPQEELPDSRNGHRKRPVVGIGLMEFPGKYSVKNPSDTTYLAYLDNLVVFVEWLLADGYDLRLVIGDVGDRHVTEEFKSLLKERSVVDHEGRVIDEPVSSVEHLLLQLASTDIVVATRFHNVLLALLLNKPVISISFHHKCASLMNDMGLPQYCHDMNHMNAERLIEQFQDVASNAENLKDVIRRKVQQSRKALDEQYRIIFNSVELRGVSAGAGVIAGELAVKEASVTSNFI